MWYIGSNVGYYCQCPAGTSGTHCLLPGEGESSSKRVNVFVRLLNVAFILLMHLNRGDVKIRHSRATKTYGEHLVT